MLRSGTWWSDQRRWRTPKKTKLIGTTVPNRTAMTPERTPCPRSRASCCATTASSAVTSTVGAATSVMPKANRVAGVRSPEFTRLPRPPVSTAVPVVVSADGSGVVSPVVFRFFFPLFPLVGLLVVVVVTGYLSESVLFDAGRIAARSPAARRPGEGQPDTDGRLELSIPLSEPVAPADSMLDEWRRGTGQLRSAGRQPPGQSSGSRPAGPDVEFEQGLV
ncbi:hypothetical protein FRAHR75_240050 [Frankia sp. Hr75.2]|nr:hypothetical protein FRAHR75_240050 [Frankia sp. Hr75.2]